MSIVFLTLAVVCAAGVLASLATGLIAMARGGAFNAKYGNKLMSYRVALQGLAILFFILALSSSR